MGAEKNHGLNEHLNIFALIYLFIYLSSYSYSCIYSLIFIHVRVVHMLLSTFAMLKWWPYRL